MKILAASFLMLCSTVAFADCDHILPGHEPVIPGSIRLCRADQSYLTVYNPNCKVPYYSAEFIRPNNVDGPARRKNNFHEDPDVPPQFRSTLNDYKKSGFDRGHMAPAADFYYSADAMSDSFLLSNMIPQFHQINAGMWSEIESFARSRALENDYVRVVSGPLFELQPIQTIGNGVCVPSATFKLIIEPNGSTTAFIVPNVPDVRRGSSVSDFIVPVNELQHRSGISFE